jgi:putative PIN family toxin of toxin-antitoxin system
LIRAVDTHILMSAIVKPQRTVGPILQGLRNAGSLLVCADLLLTECAAVLARLRLRPGYGLTTADVATVLRLVLLRSLGQVLSRGIEVCRVPTDNVILEAAVTGQAAVIVGGDTGTSWPSPPSMRYRFYARGPSFG